MEEQVSITNPNGLTLSTIFHYPGKTIRYPAVIVLHGFTGSKDEEHIVALARDLHKKNIAAVRFDMSGLGESEGTIEADYRLSNYLDDIDTVFKQLTEQYCIDPSAIGIVGHSMGGLAALLYAARNPQIRAVCAISSPAQLADAATFKNALPEWEKTGWFDRTSSRFGILSFPYDFILDAMKHDLRKAASHIHQPKLVIWGSKDKNVFPTETEEVFDFLDDPKESLVLDIDHYYKKDPKLINKVNHKVVSFFQETL